ncbi:MAG: NCS2 family permease [Candidatus Latescibacteria bacterium]|nr:NCS2 family permease [Candidatus Latescibacterota bacterium]
MRAGVTTFLTMAYIIVVNPITLAQAGVPAEGVMIATCLAAAIGSLMMGVFTNYPFALAPGMGLNAFFVFSVVLGMGIEWPTALAAVFVSGALFLVLTLTRAREAIVNAIPLPLKHAIGVGIGLFIALIGLKSAGLIVHHPGTGSLGLVEARYFEDPNLTALLPPGASLASVGLALLGLALTGLLVVTRVRGGLLIGIAATTIVGLPLGVSALPEGLVAWPTGIRDTFLALDFGGLWTHPQIWTVILTFAFVDLFDTAGTLVGVAGKAGLLDEQGHLPRARGALLADSLATCIGALLGTSTTTTYAESATGVADGGRTGFTSLTVAALFLLALFFGPLVQMVPAAATAPVLVLVGAFMMEPIRQIDFADPAEGIAAFLTILVMPLAFSITEGIAVGIVAYTLLRAIQRRGRVSIPLLILSALFLLRYLI